MHAAKVKIAFRRDVGDVGGDPALLAELPDHGRGGRVVDGHEHHGEGCVGEVRGVEGPVDVGYLFLGDAVGYFGVETRVRAHHGDERVGI